MSGTAVLHAAVVRPAAALRCDPDDVLRRILDVAGLAMHAVLRVDLQPVRVVRIFDKLINPGRAVAAFRAGIQRQIHIDRHAGVFQSQVRGLLLFVVGVADEHRS